MPLDSEDESDSGEFGEYGRCCISCAFLIFGKKTQKNNIAAKTKTIVTDIANILLSNENGTFFLHSGDITLSGGVINNKSIAFAIRMAQVNIRNSNKFAMF